MPDDDWALSSNTVDFRDEERRWTARHGGPIVEPPQDVFLSDDPGLSLVRADMEAWLAAQPECECEGLCRCNPEEEHDADGF